MIICLSEDAYKQIVSPATGDLFKDKSHRQVPGLTTEDLINKMKGYKINRDDKKVRIIKPILDNGIVVDISVVLEITNDTVVWDRG